MSFERYLLHGPDIVLGGPQEHKGETRYSWIDTRPMCGVDELEHLYVKIEKRNPQHSPVLSFCFHPENDDLLIRLVDPDTLREGKKSESIQPLNPYLNDTTVRPATLSIPRKSFLYEYYELSFHSNFLGDFIFLQSFDRKNKAFMSPVYTQYFAINIWSLFMFDCIKEININGEFKYLNKVIGKLDQKHPFFSSVFCSNEFHHKDFSNFTFSKNWERVSHKEALKISHYPTVKDFLYIDMSLYAARGPGIPKKEAINRAKKTFQKIFG